MLPTHLKPYFKSLEELLEYWKCIANLNVGDEVAFNWIGDKLIRGGTVVVIAHNLSKWSISQSLVVCNYRPLVRIMIGSTQKSDQTFWWPTGIETPDRYFKTDLNYPKDKTAFHSQLNTFKEFRSLTFPEHRITQIIKERRES